MDSMFRHCTTSILSYIRDSIVNLRKPNSMRNLYKSTILAIIEALSTTYMNFKPLRIPLLMPNQHSMPPDCVILYLPIINSTLVLYLTISGGVPGTCVTSPYATLFKANLELFLKSHSLKLLLSFGIHL